MNRTMIFAKRNFKELVRDPITFRYVLFLPAFIYILIIFLTKQINIPNSSFDLNNFTPATIIFSFSFLSLFASLLISKDRKTSFMIRLYSSPLKSREFILGYILPLLLISIIQNVFIFVLGLCFGLSFTWNIFVCLIAILPISLIFSSLGLLLGSLFTDRQASGMVSILIQVVAFTSGMWFDVDMIGGGYKVVCVILPFYHSVNLLKYVLSGQYSKIWLPLLVIVGYAILFTGLCVFAFHKKAKEK